MLCPRLGPAARALPPPHSPAAPPRPPHAVSRAPTGLPPPPSGPGAPPGPAAASPVRPSPAGGRGTAGPRDPGAGRFREGVRCRPGPSSHRRAAAGAPPLPKGPPRRPARAPNVPPRTAPARPSGRLPGQGPLDLVRLYTYSPTIVGGGFFKHATMCQKKFLGEGVNYGGGPCTVFLPIQSGPPEAHKSVGRRDLVEFC